MLYLARLPLLVILTGGSALAMMVPAIHAATARDYDVARPFFHAGLVLLVLTTLVAIAIMGTPRTMRRPRALLVDLVIAMVALPVLLAIPLREVLPDTGLFNAWWEMVSCLTTTGASLYSAERLPPTLHLWRGMVGWMGGFFMLVAAIAILAPLKIGGFELMTTRQGSAHPAARSVRPGVEPDPDQFGPGSHSELIHPSYRFLRYAAFILPIYVGLTAALWVLLLIAGDPSLIALCRAMGTLSTSGVSPVSGVPGQQSGLLGEMLVFLFLIPALSRRFWPGGGELRVSERKRDDPELRMAASVVFLVAVVLFLRHFISAIEVAGPPIPGAPRFWLGAPVIDALRAAWGGLFNALSYLTTTGWNSAQWEEARNWSGLTSPGIILAGLTIMGGGVATTAGGVKLLRVYALSLHSQRELNQMIHPHVVSGGGNVMRRLRNEGAYLAFIFFMLFATSIAATVTLISFQQIEFETATILSIAALTNTGHLAGAIPLTPAFQGTAGMASAPWEGWSGLSVFNKSVLAGAMVVGRLEILAIIALFFPEYWRR